MISCVSPVHVEVREVLRYSLEVKQQGYRVWAQSNVISADPIVVCPCAHHN